MTQIRTPTSINPRASNRTAKAVAATTQVLASSCGVVMGSIDHATCWVTFPENPTAQAKKASVLRHVGEVVPGQSVLLQFLSGDVTRPVVAGVILAVESSVMTTLSPSARAAPVTLEINGQTLTLSAQQRITLRCGKSSLVMNADGSIEIRGTELLSRASGQNAVRGASVSLN